MAVEARKRQREVEFQWSEKLVQREKMKRNHGSLSSATFIQDDRENKVNERFNAGYRE